MLPQPLSSARSWKARHLCWWLGCSVVTRAVISPNVEWPFFTVSSLRTTPLLPCVGGYES